MNTRFLLVGAVLGMLSGQVWAVTRTWSGLGEDNRWGTPKNWAVSADVEGAVPQNGDTLVFPSDGYLETVNDLPGIVLEKIAFTGTGAHSLSGASFTLRQSATSGAVALESATGEVTNDCAIVLADGEQKFSLSTARVMQTGMISGPGKLVRVGAASRFSNLTLCSPNTYTGGTRIDKGIIEIRNDYALGATNAEVYCSVAAASLKFDNMCTLLVATPNVYNPIRVAEGTASSPWHGNTFAGCQVLSHRSDVHYWNRISGGYFCATFAGPDLFTPPPGQESGCQLKDYGSAVNNHCFHGSFDTTGLKFYSGADVHLYGAVTNRLAGLSGCSYTFVPKVHFHSPMNRFNGTGASLARLMIYLSEDHVADDFGSLSLAGGYDNGVWLNGHSMTISSLTTSRNADAATSDSQGIHGSNGGQTAVLTINGTQDCLAYARFTGNLSLVWNPVDDFTLTIASNRTSTLCGPLVVNRGTMSVEGSHTMKLVDGIRVASGATFRLATSTADAFEKLRTVRVGANGRFEVNAANALSADKVDFILAPGAKLVVASGVTLSPRCVIYDGQTVAGGDYTTADWMAGEGTVHVPVVPAVKRVPTYLSLNGNAYFDTLVRPDHTTRIVFAYRTDDKTVDKPFFGERQAGFAFGAWAAKYAGNKVNPYIGTSGNLGEKDAVAAGAKGTLDFSAGGLSVNGTVVYPASAFAPYLNTSLAQYDLPLGAIASNGEIDARKFVGEIYFCSIWKGGELVRAFVPAVDANDVACLYDGVTKTLFYPLGTGTTAAAATSEDMKIEDGVVKCRVTLATGSAGTVSVNDGETSADATLWAGVGDPVTLTITPSETKAFSHWTGMADFVECDASSNPVQISINAPGTLSAVFGCRNREDPTDPRPHAYMNRVTDQTTGAWVWTDGAWASNPSWWLDGYVPFGRTDVIHFTSLNKEDYMYPHAWLDFPSGDLYMDTVISPAKPKLNLNNGWNKYTYINDQSQVFGRWQHEYSAVGGFGTTDENTPVVVNRAWTRSTFGVNTAKLEHELTITEMSGNGMIRKVGLGRFTFTQPFNGGLRLEQGTVRLGTEDVDGYVPGAYVRFDAAATDSLTWWEPPDGKTRVKFWEDAEGRKKADGKTLRVDAQPYTGQSGMKYYGPTLGAKEVNGTHLIDFGAYSKFSSDGGTLVDDSVTPGEKEALGAGAALNSNDYLTYRSVFTAYEYPSKTGSSAPITYWSANNQSSFAPKSSGDGLIAVPDATQFTGRHWLNGAPTKSEVNQNHEWHDGHSFAVYSSSVTNSYAFWHMGAHVGDNTAGGIRMAEALVYTNTLTDAECARNNRYLQKKWHDRRVNDIYPWSLDYLYLLPTDDSANLEVPKGKTAAIRTVHRPVWSELRGKPLVKTGEGTLELDRVSTNLDIVVKGGKVRFIRESAQIADEPEAAPHPLIWCDASKKESFIFAEGSETDIVAWCDCRDSSTEMLTNWVSTARFPTWNKNGPHGKPCVDFGTAFDSTGPRLGLASDSKEGSPIGRTWKTQIVDGFIVWRNIAPAGKTPVIFHDPCAVSLDRSANSLGSGPRLTGSSVSGEPAFYHGARWSVDGRFMHPVGEFFDYGRDDYIVIRCRATAPTYMNQIGGCQKKGDGGGVQIAEFIGYPYPLSDFAARQTEAYLMKKWKGVAHPDASAELDGIDSLVFEGTSAELDVASDRSFGKVAGSGTLVKTGPGTATIRKAQGFDKVDVSEGQVQINDGLFYLSALDVALDETAGIRGALSVGGRLTLAPKGTVTLSYAGTKKPPEGSFVVAHADELLGGDDWSLVFNHPLSSAMQFSLRKVNNDLVLSVRRHAGMLIIFR